MFQPTDEFVIISPPIGERTFLLFSFLTTNLLVQTQNAAVMAFSSTSWIFL